MINQLSKDVYVSESVIKYYRENINDGMELTKTEIKNKILKHISLGECIVFRENQYYMVKYGNLNIGVQINENRVNYLTNKHGYRRRGYINARYKNDLTMLAYGFSKEEVIQSNASIGIWDIIK